MDDLDRSQTIDRSVPRFGGQVEVTIEPQGRYPEIESIIRSWCPMLWYHLTLPQRHAQITLSPDQTMAVPESWLDWAGHTELEPDSDVVRVYLKVDPGHDLADYVQTLAHELRHQWQMAYEFDCGRHGKTLEEDADEYADNFMGRFDVRRAIREELLNHRPPTPPPLPGHRRASMGRPGVAAAAAATTTSPATGWGLEGGMILVVLGAILLVLTIMGAPWIAGGILALALGITLIILMVRAVSREHLVRIGLGLAVVLGGILIALALAGIIGLL